MLDWLIIAGIVILVGIMVLFYLEMADVALDLISSSPSSSPSSRWRSRCLRFCSTHCGDC
jgi:hypothetical protein